MLYVDRNPTPPSQLDLNARNGTFTLRENIEIMQILQFSATIQKAKRQSKNAYGPLMAAVVNFQKTGSQPVFIGIYGPRDSNGNRAGHALMALAAYRDDARKKDIIQVYDPNFPLDDNRYIDLYWNDAGYYTGWYYHLNDRENWGSGYDGYLNFSVYSNVKAVWNNRGREAALTAQTLSVSTDDASIYDYVGNLAAVIRDGEVTSYRSDIFPVQDPVEGTAAGTAGGGVTLWIPEEYFTVVNEDAGGKEFSVEVSGEDATVTVSTTADRVMLYANADADANVAVVNGKDKRYEMVIRSGETEEVRLTGTTQEGTPACLAQLSGELSGMGVGGGELSGADGVAPATAVSIITATTPSAISAVFADVPREEDYAPAVQWAYEAGVTTGTAQGLFTPERACTRGEALTFLWRALGCPTASATAQPFVDIKPDDCFYDAVLWAAGSGVTLGTDEARFSPGKTCSNEEFVTFLWRALGKPGGRLDFAGYDDAASWAADTGVLRGLDTKAPCQRRGAVAFLYRALA